LISIQFHPHFPHPSYTLEKMRTVSRLAVFFVPIVVIVVAIATAPRLSDSSAPVNYEEVTRVCIDLFDKDGDGKLSREELSRIGVNERGDIYILFKYGIEILFNDFDKNGDGLMDVKELTDGMKFVVGESKSIGKGNLRKFFPFLVDIIVEKINGIQRIFEEMDLNGDGKISLREWVSGVEGNKEAIYIKFFNLLDKNADGLIDQQEIDGFTGAFMGLIE